MAPERGRTPFDSLLWPALLVLAVGWAVVLLRGPVPVDETRYLQVLREAREGGWLLLRLNGEPYTHKTPLLFWLAWALARLGPSLETAARLLPGLLSALVVVATGAIGRRVGAPGAAWLQAALLLPLAYAQVLMFDPLLAAGVWLVLWAFAAGRSGLAAAAATAALLAKGPVALVHLVPLMVALAPEGWSRRRVAGRAALVLGAGLVALAAWALAAVAQVDPELRRQLLWGQTASRVAGEAAPHSEPWWYYLPVLPLVFLPATGALLGALREACRGDRLARRLAGAIAAAVVVLSLVSGKQPAYLLPLAPAAALLAARALALRPERERGLRLTAAPLLLLLTGAVAWGWTRRAELLAKFGPYGGALAADGTFTVLCAIAVTAGAGVALLLLVRRGPLPFALAAHALALALLLAPAHRALGEVMVPRRIVAWHAEARPAELASFPNYQSGFLNYVLGRGRIDVCTTRDELAAWCAAHPGGFVLVKRKAAAEIADLPLEIVLEDVSRGKVFEVRRVRP